MVITNTIPELDPSRVIYAATFGDPKLYLPEGEGISPNACRGKNLSPYRKYAPNCYTSAGSLGAKKPYQEPNWAGKIGLWCRDKDLICGAGVNLTGNSGSLISNATASHTSYIEGGQIKDIANTIIDKLYQTFKTKIAKQSVSGNRDTIILIDHTGSMGGNISKYKADARRLATETISAGGRVAVFSYGDLYDSELKKLADFGSTPDEIYAAIESIRPNGGGDGPESLLSAALGAINSVKWRAGATKSIVIITDDEYHDPDLDGTTLKQVVKRALEIDPVNIYVISKSANETFYTQLTTETNGGFYDIGSNFSISTDTLLTRPSVVFPLDEYSGNPGDEFTFTAEITGDIASYVWDLDFDGVFETTTVEPTVTKIYSAPTSGFIQLRVTDTAGNVSTGSAKVTVGVEQLATPSLSDLNIRTTPGEASLDYHLGENTAYVLVRIGDALMGVTSSTTLAISGLEEDTSLTLTPMSSVGRFGESKSVALKGDPSLKQNKDAKETDSAHQEAMSREETAPTKEAIVKTILAPNSGRL